MRKQNVFVVSGRGCGGNGVPSGEVKNMVVCAANDQKVRSLVRASDPEFSVVSVTSLVTLEEAIKKIKASLAGADSRWPVLVDPELQAAQQGG